jgi:hypothetical protein
MRLLLKSLGPGVITGAADDDPSGIATYSVPGAQLGTKLLWTALLTWPLMDAVQMILRRRCGVEESSGMKAKSRVGGRRKRSSELLCGGSHLGSGSKRRPVSNPGIIYYKPVSGPRG